MSLLLARLRHSSDAENVRLSGQTGSGRHQIETTLLTPERTFLCRPVDVERTTQIGSACPIDAGAFPEVESDGLTHPGCGTPSGGLPPTC
jgi:hypothetical protein